MSPRPCARCGGRATCSCLPGLVKAEGERRKEKGGWQELLGPGPAQFGLPPSAFRLPPSAFRLPPSAFRLPPSAFRLPPIAVVRFSHVTVPPRAPGRPYTVSMTAPHGSAALEGVVHGLILLGDGVADCNERFCTMLELGRTGIVGRPFLEL